MNNIKTIENCRKYGIENYTINEDGSIDVDGDVFLTGKGLIELPLKFRNVSGIFSCRGNQLTSLIGAPQSVGSFVCSNNQLISLVGCPQSVVHNFYCSGNQLKTLEGAPQSVVHNFYCDNNQLTSLNGAPQSVGYNFYCFNNKLISLEGAPQSVGSSFNCWDNPIYDEIMKGNEYVDFNKAYKAYLRDKKLSSLLGI